MLIFFLSISPNFVCEQLVYVVASGHIPTSAVFFSHDVITNYQHRGLMASATTAHALSTYGGKLSAEISVKINYTTTGVMPWDS